MTTVEITIGLHYAATPWEVLSVDWLVDKMPLRSSNLVEISPKVWDCSFSLDLPCRSFSYRYTVNDIFSEGTKPHRREDRWRDIDLRNVSVTRHFICRDSWSSETSEEDSQRMTAAFHRVIWARWSPKSLPDSHLTGNGAEAIVCFKVFVPRVPPDYDVVVVGSIPELGSWDPSLAVVMADADAPYFVASITVDGKVFLEYKYVVRSRSSNEVFWEHSLNRTVSFQNVEIKRKNSTTVIANDSYAYSPSRLSWKGAGVIIPVFSLRSEQDLGCGEFEDLRLLAKWCKSVGIQMIQVLPVNDTSVYGNWLDSYPYSTLSVFALHPMYLCLSKIPGVPIDVVEEMNARRKAFDKDTIDYEEMINLKLELISRTFEAKWKDVSSSSAFLDFVAANQHWLPAYAVFCYLRELYGTSDFRKWPKERGNPSPAALSELLDGFMSATLDPELESEPAGEYAKAAPYIGRSLFVQYYLHEQFSEVSKFLAENGIVLKGDIGIGVDSFSVDVWSNRRLFFTEFSTGAPPDFFSETGQNWQFPVYNWEEMQKDGFSWWRARLRHMSQYFHATRIDHVLGFFRIWAVPRGNDLTGMSGHFLPSFPIGSWELNTHGIWDFNRLSMPFSPPWMVQKQLIVALQEAAKAAGLSFDETKYMTDIMQLAAFLKELFFCDGHYSRSGGGHILHFMPKFDCETSIHECLEECLTRISPLLERLPIPEIEPIPVAPGKEPLTALQTARLRLISTVMLRIFNDRVLLKDTWDPRYFYPRFNSVKYPIEGKQMVTHSFFGLNDNGWKHNLYDLHESYFWRRQDWEWARNGRFRLRMLKNASNMMLCVEDLGLVPACVPQVLSELNLLVLRVQRMPSEVHTDFGDLSSFPYLAVTIPSSHDTPVLRSWYEDLSKESSEEGWPNKQVHFWKLLGQTGVPRPRLSHDMAKIVIEQHLNSPCMWSCFLLADLFAMSPELRKKNHRDEQINEPKHNRNHYWRYRLHIPLEKILADADLSKTLAKMIKHSNRGSDGKILFS